MDIPLDSSTPVKERENAAKKRIREELSPEQKRAKMDDTQIRDYITQTLNALGFEDIRKQLNGIAENQSKLEGIETIQNELKVIRESLTTTQAASEEAEKIAKKSMEETTKLRSEISSLKAEIKQEKDARIKLEIQQRKLNLKFYGLEEEEGTESDSLCETKIKEIFKQPMGAYAIQLSNCYRLGQKSSAPQKFPRPVLISFTYAKERQEVWYKKKNLKGTPYIIKEDLPHEIEERIKLLIPSYMAAKKSGIRTRMSEDKLYIENDKYTVETMHQLPTDLKPENVTTQRSDNTVWFFGQSSPLSNFYTKKLQLYREKRNLQLCRTVFPLQKSRALQRPNSQSIHHGHTNSPTTKKDPGKWI